MSSKKKKKKKRGESVSQVKFRVVARRSERLQNVLRTGRAWFDWSPGHTGRYISELLGTGPRIPE